MRRKLLDRHFLWKYFRCEGCGKCCEETGLPWDPQRSHKIAKFLGILVSQLIEKYYGKIISNGKHWKSEEEKRTPCPFLKSEGIKKSCLVYLVRPEACELYPFETDFGRCGVDCPAAKKVFDKLENEK